MALKGIKTNTQKQTMKQNKKQKMYRTNGKYKIRQIITKPKERTHTHTHTHTHAQETEGVQRKESAREWPGEQMKPKMTLIN